MHVAQWPAEWTSDLIDVLSILTRLITLEEAQLLLLLDAVLADYLITAKVVRSYDASQQGILL